MSTSEKTSSHTSRLPRDAAVLDGPVGGEGTVVGRREENFSFWGENPEPSRRLGTTFHAADEPQLEPVEDVHLRLRERQLLVLHVQEVAPARAQ